MTTRITVWGTGGRIFADRQECQVYLRDGASLPEGYAQGWNVRYTTELTEPVWFYLRGEEYSAQIERFVARVAARAGRTASTASPARPMTDRTIALMVADAAHGPVDSPRCRGRRTPPAPTAATAPAGGRRERPQPARCSSTDREAETVLDRLLFGDNQFFGINHMSEEKARAQAMRFQDIDAVIDVLDAAYDEGVRTFMCTTHDRIALVCDHVRGRPGALRATSSSTRACPTPTSTPTPSPRTACSARSSASCPTRACSTRRCAAARSLATKDVEGMATLLIDAEMKMFQGLRTPVDLPAEPRRRPAARPRLQGRASGSSPTTCASATAPSRASSR